MSLTVQESASLVQELSVLMTMVDGEVSAMETMIETMSMIYATIQFPVYVITQSQVELIIVPEKESPLGMNTTLFIGMITGCGLVAALMIYIVVWFVRSRHTQLSVYSYEEDMEDDDHWAGGDEQENVIDGPMQLWGKDMSDADAWLDL